MRALLSEGGPTLFRGFLADGFVDELFLTISPLITGTRRRPAWSSGGRLPELAHFTIRSILRAEHELFMRYTIVR